MRARFPYPVLALTTLLFFPLAAREARAEGNAAAAQALFEEARGLMASGNYAAACTKLEGSQALDPGPGTEFNLALCYEKSGRTASAWATYLNAATGYKTTNRLDWETRARARAAALGSTLSRVTINAPGPAPKGLKVVRDGKPVLDSEFGTALPVDPGHHVVEATCEGKPKFTLAFDLAPSNGRQTVNVVFADATTSSPAGAGASYSPPVIDGGGNGRKIAAYTLGGLGVAGLALGTVAGLVAINKNDQSLKDCPNDGVCTSSGALDANDSAQTWSTISTVGLIAGGALLVAGAIILFTAPSSKHASTASWTTSSPSLWIGRW